MKDLGHLLGRPTWRAFVVDGIGIALSPGELCRLVVDDVERGRSVSEAWTGP